MLPNVFHFRGHQRKCSLCRTFSLWWGWSQREVTGPGTLAARALSCLSEKGRCHIHGAQWEISSKMKRRLLQRETCDRHCYVPPILLQTEPKFYSEKKKKNNVSSQKLHFPASHSATYDSVTEFQPIRCEQKCYVGLWGRLLKGAI